MPEKNAQQRQQDAIDAQRKREESERAAAQIAESKSEKLLPFLNVARDRSTARLETLNTKKAVRQLKIERNETKIERLSSKAERLSVTNEMLHRLTAGTMLEAAANAIIARNQARIDKIRESKIPRCEQKIAKHQERIAKLDKRIAAQQRKIDKCTALSNVITSFVIMNPEKRREQFSQNMDVLHRVTTVTLQAKLETCNARHDALIAKMIDEKTTPAQADRIWDKIVRINARTAEITEKLSVLTAVDQPYANQPAAAQDMVQTHTAQQLDAAAQRGEVRINPLTETICVGAAERVIDRDAIQKEAAERIVAMSAAEKAAFLRETSPHIANLRNQSVKPAEIAMFGLLIAEQFANGQQREVIQTEAAARLAGMSPAEKSEFLKRPLDRSRPPVEIAMHSFILAEMQAQAAPSQTVSLSQSRDQSKGFVLNRQKRAAIAGRAAQAQHQPAKTDGQNQQHDLE